MLDTFGDFAALRMARLECKKVSATSRSSFELPRPGQEDQIREKHELEEVASPYEKGAKKRRIEIYSFQHFGAQQDEAVWR